MSSSMDYILSDIIKNCKNERKKDVAIKHLTKKMESLKVEDKLRLHLWEIIKCLQQIEPKNDDYE